MQYYIDYIHRLHEGNENELYFIDNQLRKHLETNKDNQSEIEHILDFLYSTKKSYKNIGYKTILEKTKARDRKLQSLASKNDEVEGVDYEVIQDFGDGYRFVKLKSQSSYNREGKLMSHCVASYYGRNVSIYSLRDSNNKPHATIEENNQVKGKGNKTIDNKYFGYCIKFLEIMGFSIGDNEMKNIGYHKLESIDKDLQVYDKYLYDGKYISIENIDKIIDKNGNKYMGMGLWNIIPLVDIDDEGNTKLFKDIKLVAEYSTRILGDYSKQSQSGYSSQQSQSGDSSKQSQSGHYSQQSQSGDYSQQSQSGDYSKQSQSGEYSQQSQSGEYSQQSQSGDSSKQSQSGHYSQQSQSGDYSQQSQSGYSSQQSQSGDYSKQSQSGDYSQQSQSGHSSQQSQSRDYSQQSQSGDYSKQSQSGDYSKQVSCGDSNTTIVTGEHCITADIGMNSKVKGIIGTWITLAEYELLDDNYIPKIVRSAKIDGVILKENTFYKLQGGEFIEVN